MLSKCFARILKLNGHLLPLINTFLLAHCCVGVHERKQMIDLGYPISLTSAFAEVSAEVVEVGVLLVYMASSTQILMATTRVKAINFNGLYPKQSSGSFASSLSQSHLRL